MHPILFYIFIAFTMITASFLIWSLLQLIKIYKKDILLFIDNTDRWSLIYDNVKGKDKYSYKKKSYFLLENKGKLNKKGKALYMFKENNPKPIEFKTGNTLGLSSESTMAIINNEIIKKLVQLTDKITEKLILYGSIGGIIAGIASVLILLKTFGILK